MDLPKELAFDELNDEEKYHRAVKGYMRRLCSIYEALYERFGDAGLDLIRDVSREFGTSIGMNVKKKGDVKGVAQVGRYLLKVFDMVSYGWEVKEFSEDRLVITVSRCPYPFTIDEKKIFGEPHHGVKRAEVASRERGCRSQAGRG